MDLKSALNGYFKETPLPKELSPDKIAAILQPRTQPKKSVETRDDLPQDKAPAPAPKPQPKPQPQQKSEPPAEPVLNASTFIKIVRHHHLTGSEFLSLLGNSKISNKAYQEIESNPGLTVKRLIEILEESPLTSEDYKKLIIAIQRSVNLKEEAKAKLSTEHSAPESAPAPKPVPALVQGEEESAQKPAEVQEVVEKKETLQEEQKVTGVPMPRLFEDDDEDTDRENKKNRKEKREKKEKKKKTNITDIEENSENEEYSEDIEDIEDIEEDSEDEQKPESNKSFFIICSAAAVLLIALSFGLRWYFTGSWLPTSNVQAEELELDENGIFEVLKELPASGSPAFAENRSYSAGGRIKESPLLSSLVTDNRMIYFTDNTLYIFEKLGGQLEQLDARKYDDGIQILGLLKLNSGVAVVTSSEGRAYDFTYTSSPETEEDVPTVVNSTVERPETVIELLDGEKPENRNSIRLFGLSGSLAQLWAEGDRILAVTSESIAEGAAAQEPNSFMPYAYMPAADSDGNRMLCPAENVFVPENAQYSSFAAVFSLDVERGSFSSAAVAGGSGQLVSRIGSDLFIGQNKLLVRYDVSGDVRENGFCAIPGTVGDFSAAGVFQDQVRVTFLEEGSAALIVLDNELNVLSEVKNLGNGETPVATCYNWNETYLITETGTLYGIDGNNEPMTTSNANITDAAVYKWNDSVGIRIEPLGDADRRTGLSVTAVALNGSLSVLSTLEISSKTVAEQALDEYISSPAETDLEVLGASTADGILVVPVVYFDGVSEVERFVICNLTEQGSLSFSGSICEYDRQSSLIFALADKGNVIAVTGDRLLTAKSSDAGIIGYFSSKPPAGTYSYYG